jgi:hypothetical protein
MNHEPKRTSAVSGSKIVRCSGWMHCGKCGRAVPAADVDVRGDGIVLVCQGCHRDGGDALSLCLVNEDGVAADANAATTTSTGRVACTTALLKKGDRGDGRRVPAAVDRRRAGRDAAARPARGRCRGGDRADQMERGGSGLGCSFVMGGADMSSPRRC